MRDWKAAVRTWMRNDKRWKENKQKEQVVKTNFKSINY